MRMLKMLILPLVVSRYGAGCLAGGSGAGGERILYRFWQCPPPAAGGWTAEARLGAV